MPWKAFEHGWVMVVIAAAIPLLFSSATGLSSTGIDIAFLESTLHFRDNDDISYIISYTSFGLLHIILCIAINFYVYDIVKNSTVHFIFMKFRLNHLMAFAATSLSLILVIFLTDIPLKFMSRDILWVALKKMPPNSMLFQKIYPLFGSDFRAFDIIPLSLVIAAFYPASSIMMAIPQIIARMRISADLTLDEITAPFLADFEVLYYLMVAMLMSSTIATHLYLQTPRSTIDPSKSQRYTHLCDSTFTTWSIIYFLILLMVLLYSYALVSSKIRKTSLNNDIITNTKRFREVRDSINIHFFIRRKVSLFASSFSPILTLAIKSIIG